MQASEKKVSFGGISRKRKAEEDIEESEGDQTEIGEDQSDFEEEEDELDFGDSFGAVAFNSLEDCLAALARKFGQKKSDPAQDKIPKAPPLEDRKDFEPPNKS